MSEIVQRADGGPVTAALERIGQATLDHLQEQAVAVVLVGRFRPEDFGLDQPIMRRLSSGNGWGDASLDTMRPDYAKLSGAGSSLEVTVERVTVTARTEPFVRLVDVAIAVAEGFTQDAVQGLIFVYAFRFSVLDLRQQFELGRRLAPLEAWGMVARLFEAEGLGTSGGLSSLTMQQTILEGGVGTLRVTVQPALPVGSGPGVFMQMERSFARTDMGQSGTWFVQSCADRYGATLNMCKGIVKGMTDHARSL